MSDQHKITPPVKIEMEVAQFQQLYNLFFGMTRAGTCPVKEFNDIFATLDEKAKIVYGMAYEYKKAELLEIVNKSK